jgi:hypothetical protein
VEMRIGPATGRADIDAIKAVVAAGGLLIG